MPLAQPLQIRRTLMSNHWHREPEVVTLSQGALAGAKFTNGGETLPLFRKHAYERDVRVPKKQDSVCVCKKARLDSDAEDAGAM